MNKATHQCLVHNTENNTFTHHPFYNTKTMAPPINQRAAMKVHLHCPTRNSVICVQYFTTPNTTLLQTTARPHHLQTLEHHLHITNTTHNYPKHYPHIYSQNLHSPPVRKPSSNSTSVRAPSPRTRQNQSRSPMESKHKPSTSMGLSYTAIRPTTTSLHETHVQELPTSKPSARTYSRL